MAIFHSTLHLEDDLQFCGLLIKKDRTVVGRGRTVALRSNAAVADLLLAAPAADGHAPAADGDADTFALGQLCEKFIDLASTRLARTLPAVRYYLYEDLGPDQRSTQENFIFLLVVM
ncbi:hypothetical protein QL285_029775 [Trifolium repens]|nr:hypothetical protein QL285_029775 [Trifolium repens]